MRPLIKVIDILAFIIFGAICAYFVIGIAAISSFISKRRHVSGELRELSFVIYDLISNKYRSMYEDALLEGYIARHYCIYLDFNNTSDRYENIEDKIFFYSIAAHPGGGIYKAGFRSMNILLIEAKVLLRGALLVWMNRVNFIKAHDPHLLGFNGLIIAKLFGLPCVLHINSDFGMKYLGTGKIASPMLISRGIERIFESMVMVFYDLIMADRKFYRNSRSLPKLSRRKYRAFGVRVDGLHYLEPASRRDLKESLGLKGRKVLLYVGRLHPVKYAEDAVKAISIVKKSVPSAALLMVGTGILRRTLERMADEYGIGDSVLFLGQKTHEELVDILYTADLLLAPHGGVTLVESALASTPVIAYDFDWHSEFLVDGETGYIVPFRDFEGMARKAVDILTNESVRAKMRDRCRRKAVSGYSREASMRNERKVYEELIGA